MIKMIFFLNFKMALFYYDWNATFILYVKSLLFFLSGLKYFLQTEKIKKNIWSPWLVWIY